MAIFIGRNIEQESKVWLENQGVEFHCQSLIEIQLIEPDFVFFQKIAKHTKNWIITSKWAAIWLQQYHKTIGFNRADSVFCLSEKQAEILYELSDLVFVSAEKNIQSLSQLVQQKNMQNLCVCLKGNRSLKASGFEFAEVEVYQNWLSKPKISNQFEVYLFFSPSGIESFVQGQNQISEKAKIVVIGQTTARKARKVFSNDVIVSDEQSELGTIKTAASQLQEVI